MLMTFRSTTCILTSHLHSTPPFWDLLILSTSVLHCHTKFNGTKIKPYPFSSFFFSSRIPFQLLVSQLRKFLDMFHLIPYDQFVPWSHHSFSEMPLGCTPTLQHPSPSLCYLRPWFKRLLCGAPWLQPFCSLCLFQFILLSLTSRTTIKGFCLLAPTLYPAFSIITSFPTPAFFAHLAFLTGNVSPPIS